MSPSQGVTSSSLLMLREQGKKKIVETLMSSESLEVHTCWLREPRNTSRIYVVENRCPKQVTSWTCTTNATHMCESMTIWTRKQCLVTCYEHGHMWDGVLHGQACNTPLGKTHCSCIRFPAICSIHSRDWAQTIFLKTMKMYFAITSWRRIKCYQLLCSFTDILFNVSLHSGTVVTCPHTAGGIKINLTKVG